MKKILLSIAIVTMFGLGASAQGRVDGYFDGWNDDTYETRGDAPDVSFPNHFETNDNGAPVGSGLVILTALGAGYAVMRKRK